MLPTKLRATVAHTADLHFDFASTNSTRTRSWHHDFKRRKTLDRPALGTYEMGMRGRIVAGTGELEPPGMGDIGATRDSSFDEIAEVAIDRCRIPFMTRQSVDDIGMG